MFPLARQVQAVSIIIRRVVDKETSDLTAGGFIDGTESQPVSQGNREAGNAPPPGFDPTIAGEDHRNLLTELPEPLGQGAQNIAQPPGLGPGDHLGSDEQNAHAALS